MRLRERWRDQVEKTTRRALVARLVDNMVRKVKGEGLSEKIVQTSDKHSFGLYEMVSERKKGYSEPDKHLLLVWAY